MPREFPAQFAYAMPGEFDPAVGAARQPIENFTVEDEYAIHATAGLKRGIQGGMVMAAQVAPKPDQRDAVFHVCFQELTRSRAQPRQTETIVNGGLRDYNIGRVDIQARGRRG